MDSVDNEPIVTFVPNKTGTWKDYVYGSKKFESTQNITGIHDVYLTFSGEILPAEVEVYQNKMLLILIGLVLVKSLLLL